MKKIVLLIALLLCSCTGNFPRISSSGQILCIWYGLSFAPETVVSPGQQIFLTVSVSCTRRVEEIWTTENGQKVSAHRGATFGTIYFAPNKDTQLCLQAVPEYGNRVSLCFHLVLGTLSGEKASAACTTVAYSELKVGREAKTPLAGSIGHVRESPDPNSRLLATLSAGKMVTVLEGPYCVAQDSAIWYRVQYGEISGWMPEWYKGTRFLMSS